MSDSTQPQQPQPLTPNEVKPRSIHVKPREVWFVRLDINVTRKEVLEVPGQPLQSRDIGASNHQQLGEGATPSEAYRVALERMRPIVKAYQLEGGPLPIGDQG